jgi:hypothetical protein
MTFRRHAAFARQQGHRVARQQPDEGEGQHGNPDEGRDQLGELGDEEAEHGGEGLPAEVRTGGAAGSSRPLRAGALSAYSSMSTP